MKINSSTLKQAVINAIDNNSFYSVLFSIVTAGYIDYLFSESSKKIWVHLLTLIIILVIITLPFLDIVKFMNDFSVYFYVIFAFYISLLTIYLKYKAVKKLKLCNKKEN
jgi:hypothetical protein